MKYLLLIMIALSLIVPVIANDQLPAGIVSIDDVELSTRFEIFLQSKDSEVVFLMNGIPIKDVDTIYAAASDKKWTSTTTTFAGGSVTITVTCSGRGTGCNEELAAAELAVRG
jgi:hypothetical protein